MVQPINYMTDVLGPIEGYLQGIKFGEGINSERLTQDATRQNTIVQRQEMDRLLREEQRQVQAAQALEAQVAQQQARAEATAARLMQFASDVEAGTANPADLRMAMAEFPEAADQFQTFWTSINDERKANELQFGQQLSFALANDNIEAAERLLRTRRDAAEAAGDMQGVATHEAMLIELQQDPKGLLTQTLMPLSAVMPVEDFDRYFNDVLGLGGGDEPESVRALRIRAEEAGLQPGTPEYQAFMSEGGRGPLVQNITNTGDQVDPRPITSAPAKDFQRVWDEEAQTFRDVVIPGSETALAMADVEDKAESTADEKIMMLSPTLSSLNLNIAAIEGDLAGENLPVTGLAGDFRRTVVGRALTGDAAVDFANRSNQVTDAAALAEIQRMRENSPTGGAVGALTDGERVAIGNAVTALNASTSAEEYLRAAKAYRDLALNIAYKGSEWRLNDDGTVTVLSSGASDAGTETPAPTSGTAGGGQPTRLRFNPETGEFE